MVERSGINVRGSINALLAGESVTFPRYCDGGYIRCVCSSLKEKTDRVFRVNKKDEGFVVTRTE